MRVQTRLFPAFCTLLACAFALLGHHVSYAQNFGMNSDGSTPNSHAILDIKSTSKGLLIPRMTTAQRTALGSSMGTTEQSMLVFDTDLNSYYFWTGTAWTALGNDNLGSHIASQSIQLNGNSLSNNGGNGLSINDDGNAGLGITPSSEMLLYMKKSGATNAIGITQAKVGGGNSMEFTTVDGAGNQTTRLMITGGNGEPTYKFYKGWTGSENVIMTLNSAPAGNLLLFQKGATFGPIGITQGLVGGDKAFEFTTTDQNGSQATRLMITGGNSVPDFKFYKGSSSSHSQLMVLKGNTGSLGIGVNAPSHKLEVAGTGKFTGALTVGNYTLPTTDGTSGQVLATDGSGSISWNTLSGDNLGNHTATQSIQLNGNNISNNGTGGIWVNDAGNVSIGTNQSNFPFMLKNNQNVIANSTLDWADPNKYNYVIHSSTGANQEGVGIGFGSSGGDPKLGAGIVFKKTGINSLGNLMLMVKRNGNSFDEHFPALTVTGISGNVGIGTTTPQTLLDVAGTGKFTGALTIGSYTLPTTDGTAGQVLATDGSGSISWNTLSGDNLGNHTATQSIQLNGNNISNNGGDGIVLNDAGYMALGSTETKWPLTLVDNQNLFVNANKVRTDRYTYVIRSTAGTNNQGVGIGFGNGSNSQVLGAGILFKKTGVHSTGDLMLAVRTDSVNSASTNDHFAALTVQGISGNIGIGTVSPEASLHVVGKSKFTDSLTVGNYTLPTADGTSGQVLATDGSGNISWASTNVSQTLSLSGSNLSISGGNTIDISSASDQSIYSTNGTVAQNRTVTLNNSTFTFTSTGVRNALVLQRTDNNNDLGIAFKNSGSWFPAAIVLPTEGGSNAHGLDFNTIGAGSDVNSIGATMRLTNSGAVILPAYGQGNNTGTEAKLLAVTSSGNMIEADIPFLSYEGTNKIVKPNSLISDIANDDFVFGSTQLADANNTSYDNRFFFDKSKAAFRAGAASATAWDDANVGDYSAAFGLNSKATGIYSFATGDNNTASGPYSTAIGGDNTASGIYSFALGDNSTASGLHSFALGLSTVASGQSSYVLGISNTSPSYGETTLGVNATLYTPNNATGFNATDRLFTIGNGSSSSNRSNALVVLKNGNTTIGGDATINGVLKSTNIQTAAEALQVSGLGWGMDFYIDTDANSSDKYKWHSDNTEIMVLDGSGNLQIDGTLTQSSDRRLKKDFQHIEQPLAKINALNGYYYYWKNRSDAKQQVGVIAQEVEAVLPQLITTDTEGFKAVEYTKLTALLIEGMKAQQQQIEELKLQNEKLQAQISKVSALEAKNEALQAQVKKINQLEAMLLKMKAQMEIVGVSAKK